MATVDLKKNDVIISLENFMPGSLYSLLSKNFEFQISWIEGNVSSPLVEETIQTLSTDHAV